MFGLFNKNPSKEEFARMVMKEAKRAGVPGEFQYNPEAYTLISGKSHFYLGNFYNDYCHAKGNHRKKILQNALKT